MKSLKKTISIIVTFSLVLSGLSGCGKGGGNLVNRDGTAAGTIYQNCCEDIKTEDLQRRGVDKNGRGLSYDLRQDVAASNAQTSSKDGQIPVVPSTTGNLRIGYIGNGAGLDETNLIGTRGKDGSQQNNNFSRVSFSKGFLTVESLSLSNKILLATVSFSKGFLTVERNVLSFRGNVPSELKDNKGDTVQSVKGLKSVQLMKGLKINDKSLSFHGQVPGTWMIQVAITGEEGAAYIKAANKKAEEKRKPAVQCSMETDDSRFWLFDKHDDEKGTKSWEEQLETDEGQKALLVEKDGKIKIWGRGKQGVVWMESTTSGNKWLGGPDGMKLTDTIAEEIREIEAKNPNSHTSYSQDLANVGGWHWVAVSYDKGIFSVLFGREGWLWLLSLSEEERKKFIEETTAGQALSKTENWQLFNLALEEDKGETRNKLLAMKQPCHIEEEKANKWLDSPYGRYRMRISLHLIRWLGIDQGKLYQKAYSEKIEIFKSSPFAAWLKKWEKKPEAVDWIRRQMRTQRCDGKTFQKDMKTVIDEKDCLAMHPESGGIEWIAEQDTSFWEEWLNKKEQGGKDKFLKPQDLTEHLEELQKDYGLIFVRTDVWLNLINSEHGNSFLIPKKPEYGDPEYEKKYTEYTKTLEESKKFMESEAWFEFLISQNGLKFLKSKPGKAFWGSDNGYYFLISQNGLKFLNSENWQEILNSKEIWQDFYKTDAWAKFLNSPDGLEFLKSGKGKEWSS